MECSKIILAGGSNLAFGINSEKLEKEFGVPVVNLGLHAGLGVRFILNELKHLIQENDIVFLSFEYFLSLDGSYDLKKHTSDIFPVARNYYKSNYYSNLKLNFEKKHKVFKSIFSDKNQNLVADSIYLRDAFNKFGDAVGHLNKRSPKELKDRRKMSPKKWDAVKEINEFYEYTLERNVKVYFVFPNYPAKEFEKNKDVIKSLEQDLKENLLVEILGYPGDFVFLDNYFFDTVYHLNKEGRKLRTEQLIKVIKNSTAINNII